jgi:hypothetical protein
VRERSALAEKWQRRLALVAASGANSLLLPLLNPLVAFLVVRLASAELWGAFVEPLVIAQFAAHVIGWGNRDYLLRAFSRDPATWAPPGGSLVTRLALFAAGGRCCCSAGRRRAAWLVAWTLALVLDRPSTCWWSTGARSYTRQRSNWLRWPPCRWRWLAGVALTLDICWCCSRWTG